MSILDLFFPRRCVACGKLGKYICLNCRHDIRTFKRQLCPVCFNPSLNGETHFRCLTYSCLDGLFIYAKYTGPIRSSIKLLKYHLVSDLAFELADLVIGDLPGIFLKYDCLIPVPLHRNRLKLRGFNQSEILAREISRKLKIPLVNNVLLRIKETLPQYQLSREERLSNVSGIFSCKDKELLKDKKIIIIDDVTTTLATVKECAKELKSAGAQTVRGLVIAHGK